MVILMQIMNEKNPELENRFVSQLKKAKIIPINNIVAEITKNIQNSLDSAGKYFVIYNNFLKFTIVQK